MYSSASTTLALLLIVLSPISISGSPVVSAPAHCQNITVSSEQLVLRGTVNMNEVACFRGVTHPPPPPPPPPPRPLYQHMSLSVFDGGGDKDNKTYVSVELGDLRVRFFFFFFLIDSRLGLSCLLMSLSLIFPPPVLSWYFGHL